MSRDLYRRLAGFAVVVVVGLGAGAALAESRCVSLRLPDPLLLPDGSVYPAGQLRLCRKLDFSPVSTLHETYVDGRPVGLLRSRRVANESRGEGPAVVRFVRDDQGRLALTGYAVRLEREGFAYRFEPATAGRAPAERPDEPIVVAAARLD